MTRFQNLYTKPPRRRKHTSTEAFGTVHAQWIPQIDAYKVEIPQNDKLRDLLTALIREKVPVSDRELNTDEENVWYFRADVFDALLPILKAVYRNCAFNILDKATVDQYNQGLHSTQIVLPEQLAEEFFRLIEKAGVTPHRSTLDQRVVKKDYLRAAMFYHPDRNPNGAGYMSRLNALWSDLQGAYFK
jgi:hypothetical protein